MTQPVSASYRRDYLSSGKEAFYRPLGLRGMSNNAGPLHRSAERNEISVFDLD